MRLRNILIVVEDIEKSKKFYHDLFGLDVILDNEGNIIEVCRHPKSIIKLKVDNKLQINDMMRLKVFDKLEVL